MFRTRSGFVYQSFSDNDAQTWSVPFMLPLLPNPDSKIALLRLSTGVVALAFNDHQRPLMLVGSREDEEANITRELASEGSGDESDEVPAQHELATRVRHRLTVALSEDGSNWHRVARVDMQSTGGDSQLQLHYPSMLELPHGKLLVGYTRSVLNDFQPGEEMNAGASRANKYEMRMAEFDLMALHSNFQYLKQEEAKRRRLGKKYSGILSWILSFFWRT
mmetsp:Transcript_33292/g.46113  ORF Transcript_33292/g.46113 Transcript_33292/m.46113 type:complete len:220 (+) Transcript_33292:3-662(+)